MSVVDRLHVTGEGGPKGPGPSQGKINNQGDAYLSKEFPELSKIVSARRRPEALVPHRKGDIDGDGKLDGKDTAILEHYARLRGATLAPVAASKPAATPAASGDGPPYVWFAAATLFFVVASLRRRGWRPLASQGARARRAPAPAVLLRRRPLRAKSQRVAWAQRQAWAEP